MNPRQFSLPKATDPSEIQAAPELPKLKAKPSYPELSEHITDIRGYIQEGLKAAHQEMEMKR